MLRDLGARNKTEERRICDKSGKVLRPRRIYRKAGIHAQGVSDDASEVNVHGLIPARWLTLGMLLLNLAVWLDAAAQLAS